MEEALELFPHLLSRRLNEFTFCGSHDSAAYRMIARGCFQRALGLVYPLWAQAQSMTIFEQLVHGVRFLDLRVGFHECAALSPTRARSLHCCRGDYHIVHGPVLGPPLLDVLIQLLDFLTMRAKRDVILIHFVPQTRTR